MNDLEQIKLEATRDGFGEALVELGETNSNVVVLSADVSSSTRCDEFEKKFPKRFFQIGIAEQNLAGIASGLGVSGKIPFMSAYAVFSPGRNWEQIRTIIAYNDSNVKIAGHHAGLLTGADGGTHQVLEDISLMRSLPNMKVIVPCDSIEAKKATIAAAKIWGPVYIRLAREKTPVMTEEKSEFIPGKSYILWESKKPQILIIGAGPILHNAILAAKELDEAGVGTIVLNCHTIKPLDEETILKLAKKCGAVVSVEEHSVIGGLGSAISELLAKKYPVPMEFVGTNDVFGETGSAKELYKKYGLDVKDIKNAIKKVVKRK
jgi:transketolase